MPELHRYQIVSNGRAQYALGYVYGDPWVDDGTHVRTARIVLITGDVISTRTKSYLLKDPA